MADEQKIILAQIDIDIEASIKEAARLAAEIDKLKEETMTLKKTQGETSAEYIKSNATLKAAQTELKNQEAITQKIILANRANSGSLEEMRAQLVVVSKQWAGLSQSERENTDSGKALTAEKLRLAEAINELQKSTGNYTGQVGNYEIATKSLRQEIKELTATVAQLKINNQEGTEEYKKAINRLGELKDTMSDVSAEAKILGSDTKHIDMLVGSVQAVGAAGQLAEAGMQAFGSENEDVTKGIQKLVIIQSAMNATQEIGNALQKESAFMIALNTAKTNIASAAQYVYTIAVGTSTGALKAFRIALLATGIGAIIVGIGLLVENWDKLTGSIDNSAEALKKMNSFQDAVNKRKKDLIEYNQRESEATQESIKNEIAIAQERGKSQLELIALNQKLAQSKIDAALEDGKIYKKDIENIEELKKQQKELSYFVTLAAADKVEGDKKSEDHLKKLQDEYDNLSNRIEIATSIQKRYSDGQVELLELGIKKQKIIDEQSFNSKNASIEKQLLLVEKGSEKELSLKKEQLDLQTQQELKNVNLTEQEKETILIKNNEDKKRLDAEFTVDKLNTELEILRLQNQSKLALAQEQNRLLTEQDIEAENKRLEFLSENERIVIQERYDSNLISQQEYNLQITQLETDLENQKHQIRVDFDEQERQRKIDVAQTNYENDLALAQENMFAVLEQEAIGLEMKRQQEIAYAEKIGADTSKIEAKYFKAKKAIAKAERDAKLALAADFANNIATIAGEGTAVGKAAAVASTTISTYQSATGAYAALAPIPIVGPALGIAAAAAAVASGLANVKKILSVKSGLPGETSGASSSVSATEAPAATVRTNVNPEVGAGIISRSTQLNTDQNNITLQPTLVEDDVTNKQRNSTSIKNTATV